MACAAACSLAACTSSTSGHASLSVRTGSVSSEGDQEIADPATPGESEVREVVDAYFAAARRGDLAAAEQQICTAHRATWRNGATASGGDLTNAVVAATIVQVTDTDEIGLNAYAYVRVTTRHGGATAVTTRHLAVTYDEGNPRQPCIGEW